MDIQGICSHFNLKGEFLKAKILTAGNINNTYKVAYKNERNENEEYIVQKINKYVFKQPEIVMNNITSISEFISGKLQNMKIVSDMNVLEYMSTKDNIAYYKDQEEEYWRCYKFVGDSDTFNTTDDLFIIEQAGKGYGEFQRALSDFDATKLNESIPNFHNTEVRYYDFIKSVKDNLASRASCAEKEIDYLLSKKDFALSLCDMTNKGLLPIKVTHNDTKCNNILFDRATKKAKAVIDLDTVMPGLVAYDYGDAVRSLAPTCAEDETDFSKISINMDKIDAFTKGFVSVLGNSLTNQEFDSLATGTVVMTLELATRFLKDYLDGDKYFKVKSSTHNLERARCQIELAKQFESKLPQMKKIIENYR